MHNERINSVVIVGGGTAGWLTACTLAKNLGSINPQAIQVSIVESPDIPTIGVGEGTWPTMRRTLENIGIDEGDFIKRCSATFKQGTKFINWKANPANSASGFAGVNNSYYNLFSSIYDPGEFNLAPYWAMGYAGENVSYADAVSAQAYACEMGLAPKKITSKSYDAIQSYAYHLDAGEFAGLLKEHAIEKLGVKLIEANLEKTNLDEQGFIDTLDTDRCGQIKGDFYIDCTGFKSLLLGQALDVPFKDVGDVLLTDSAIAIQVPYPDENSELACVTKSTAQSAGWIWDIGLSHRRGTGHVYSSAHMSDDQAEKILRDYIAKDIAKDIASDAVSEQANVLEAKRIKMHIGYRHQFWKRNCVAVGLSAAFVEPLEASAIFLVEAAGNMISDLFPRTRSALPHAEKKFNDSFQFRWGKTIDFIKMHYFLSKRDDSEFWQDNKCLDTVPDSLQEKLEAWKSHPISKYDFSDINEPFPHESYQYILHGMGFEQNLQDHINSYAMHEKAQQCFKNVRQATQHITKDLPTHRELLNKVQQYGFQNI